MLIVFSSCKKWLNVNESGFVTQEELLQDREGFEKLLSSIYLDLGKPELYGRELKFGMLDAIAGYWQVPDVGFYQSVYNVDYENPNVLNQINAIWSGLYGAIRKCNVILENIDKLEKDAYRDLIEGEAIGLRGYLHFELFKLFGPIVVKDGLQSPSIPYYKQASKVPQNPLLSGEVLDLIELDLLEAGALLENDPLISNLHAKYEVQSKENYTTLLDHRSVRMNYYAVLALLARKSQWEGDAVQAGSRAESLIRKIESRAVFKLISFWDIYSPGFNDPRFSTENIFGLYVPDHRKYVSGYFGTVNQPNAIFQVLRSNERDAFEYLLKLNVRNQHWYANPSGLFIKFDIPEESRLDTLSQLDRSRFFEIQLINLPELYLIAAEAFLAYDKAKSLHYFNILLKSRNLNHEDLTSSAALEDQIALEVQQEYIGEGYLFFFNKRRNLPLFRLNGNLQPSQSVYVFPQPEQESVLRK